MSRKRVLAVTTAAMLIFYLISCGFLFFMSLSMASDFFHNQAKADRQRFNSLLDYCITPEELNYGLADETVFPRVYAVVDSAGNVLSKSTSALICYDFPKARERLFIDMSPYLTDDVLQQFKDEGIAENPAIRSVSLHCDGDNYIPVEGWFYTTDSQQFKKIVFTDETADVIVEGGVLSLNLLKDRAWNTVYDKLNLELEKFLSDFTSTHENRTFNGGGGFEDYDRFFFEYHQEKFDREICIYYAEGVNMLNYTLKNYFLPVAGLFTVMFFVAGIVILAILNYLYKKKERDDNSRAAFVAAAAHELKTPIAVIANKSECILENVAPELNTDYVNSIYDESVRMSRMVKTLLQYNNLRSDSKIEKKKENVSDIVNRQLERYQPLFEAGNITLINETDPMCTMKCNKDLTSLVADNFLSNAVKFTPPGGIIKIETKQTGGKTRLEIFNSGSRISPEDAPHIWEELYIGDKSRTRADNSTGMGLAVSRIILDRQKFDYGFYNSPEGVTFYFREK